MNASGQGLEAMLEAKYHPTQWSYIHELRQGTGFGKGCEGRIDGAAFNCWPSKGKIRMAFEIKRSRSDFTRELRQPEKRKWVEDQFHRTYFVCPHGILKPEDMPDGWGLLIASKVGSVLFEALPAPRREPGPLEEGLALSVIRTLSTRLQKQRTR